VRLEQAAVANRAETRRFMAVNSHGGRLVQAADPGSYEVNTVDLPALLREKQPRNLLLKMDVEGEESVLLPALAPLLPVTCAIFFETHSGDPGWNDARRLLQDRGFEVQQLNARGLYIDGFALRR
jgi:FkbM family methyltransferase